MKKIALVTGASRGIGRAIARQLGEEGYAVAINCLHHIEQAEALQREWQAQGITCAVFPCDVGDFEAVQSMQASIENLWGPVSVLVNNAGIAQQKLFTDLSVSDWQRMMSVHVDGTFNTCRVFLPGMLRAHNGCIVNVSSMWGQVGGSCEVHYSAAKAAVIGLTKALAKEVGPSGVRVNCVAPGVIETDMLGDLDEASLGALAEETPLGRLGTVQDVADAVSYLVSDKAAFITGQVLAPNGGIVI